MVTKPVYMLCTWTFARYYVRTTIDNGTDCHVNHLSDVVRVVSENNLRIYIAGVII